MRVRKVPAGALEGKAARGGLLVWTTARSTTPSAWTARFAAEHHAGLPFLGWECGRRDGYATERRCHEAFLWPTRRGRRGPCPDRGAAADWFGCRLAPVPAHERAHRGCGRRSAAAAARPRGPGQTRRRDPDCTGRGRRTGLRRRSDGHGLLHRPARRPRRLEDLPRRQERAGVE